MSDTKSKKETTKSNQPGGFLGFIEKVGNKLPDPFWLFVILGGLVLVSSFIFNKMGLSATNPEDGKKVEIVNPVSYTHLTLADE